MINKEIQLHVQLTLFGVRIFDIGVEHTSVSTQERAATKSFSLGRLRQMLITYFNETELRNLVSDLGINYEYLSGDGMGDKARELIAYLERRGRLPEFLEVCKSRRPHVSWPEQEPEYEQIEGL